MYCADIICIKNSYGKLYLVEKVFLRYQITKKANQSIYQLKFMDTTRQVDVTHMLAYVIIYECFCWSFFFFLRII